MRKTSLNITETQAERLAAIKAKTGQTLTAILEAAIEAHYQAVMADPALVLGYIQPQRAGDLTADAECVICGGVCDPGGVWWQLAANATGQLQSAGPLCSRCAMSE